MKSSQFFHTCLTETQNEYLLWDLDTCILGLRKRTHSGLTVMRPKMDFPVQFGSLRGDPRFVNNPLLPRCQDFTGMARLDFISELCLVNEPLEGGD